MTGSSLDRPRLGADAGADDGLDPIEAPLSLGSQRARAFDRGTMLTEPNPGQIVEFLQRNGIEVTERDVPVER